jgi:bifunctional DNA-binding transcriptional regulator/antitoxin component of YhaV-PrlF toxin-antitoxin module
MKILKEKSREYKGREYVKYKVNLPEVVLRSAGFNAGDELEVEVEKGKVVLTKSSG